VDIVTTYHVSKNHNSEWCTMNLRQGFAIHLPSKHDFVGFHLVSWHCHGVVVDLALLKVRVSTEELQVLASLFQSPAVFDDFLQAYAGPSRCSNGSLAPWCIDKLVSIPRIFVDLLDSSGAGALKSNYCGHTRKFRFILKISERDLLGVVDQAFNFQEIFIRVNLWNATVITNKMILIWGDSSLENLVRYSLKPKVHTSTSLFLGGSPLYGNCST